MPVSYTHLDVYKRQVYEFLNNGGYQGRLIDYVPMFWDFATEDDGMMTSVPYFDEPSAMPSKTLMYRKDWLDNLGVTEDQLPKTIDEFVDLMYRFANEDPDGNGVKDTYGFSQSAIRAIFGAYGSQYDSDMFWLAKEDGTLESVSYTHLLRTFCSGHPPTCKGCAASQYRHRARTT